jgi:hypothetical protein
MDERELDEYKQRLLEMTEKVKQERGPQKQPPQT